MAALANLWNRVLSSVHQKEPAVSEKPHLKHANGSAQNGSTAPPPPSAPAPGLTGTAQALLKQVQALEANPEDKASKMAVAKLAKKIGTEAGGAEAIIPMYAVAFGEIGATYTFMMWKLFDKIPQDKSISYNELADAIGGEEEVISRLGGMLVASGRLVQTSPNHITHSPTSHIFRSDHTAGHLFRTLLEHGLRGFVHWPEYFATYGIKEPQEPTHNPFTFAMGHPALNVFDVVALDEDRQQSFAASMRSKDSIAARFGGPATLYDFGWLGEEKDVGRVLLVDVGGSHGDTLKSILLANPSIPQERCVLQDRAEVIEESARGGDAALARIQRVAHDFNQEQPTKGALVYLLRRVLHDYGDAICARILVRLAAALPRDDDRARVLIMDQVVSSPPTPGNAAADLVMFNIGGKERTPECFAKIVGEAGMRVVKIHRSQGSEMGAVECALV